MANTFKRKLERHVGTGVTTIDGYVVPSGTQTTVIGLVICNITSSQVLADCKVFDGTDNHFMVKNAPIPAGGSLVVVGGDQKVVLEAGDSVKVSSDTASSLDVIMSVLEIT